MTATELSGEDKLYFLVCTMNIDYTEIVLNAPCVNQLVISVNVFFFFSGVFVMIILLFGVSGIMYTYFLSYCCNLTAYATLTHYSVNVCIRKYTFCFPQSQSSLCI